MRRTIAALLVLAGAAAAGAVAYQTAGRERAYRALLARGDAAFAEEQSFGAIEAYSGAIALRPDSMLAHLRRGETYRRRGERGDLEQAARDFRTASALDPSATRPLEELGDALFQLQRYAQAADAYAKGLRLDDRSARIGYKLALTQFTTRDYDAAVSTLEQMARLHGTTSDAQYLMGMALRDGGRRADAIQAYERAVGLSPGFVAAREELAELYGSAGRWADELEQLQLLASLDREHIERQIDLALAQARGRHADLAVLTLGNALQRAPNHLLVYGALGRVWLDIAESRDDRVARSKALEALSRAVTESGTPSDVLTLFGRALLLDGQTERAEQALQQAVTRFPIDPSAFLSLAVAAERQGHFNSARQALLRYGGLVRDDSEFVAHAAKVASLSVKVDDAGTAVAALGRAVEAAPSDALLMALLADAQLRSGDRTAARESIARGLELDPAQPLLLTLARRVR
jgi:tetratricopeptide (TPR) repeat protein